MHLKTVFIKIRIMDGARPYVGAADVPARAAVAPSKASGQARTLGALAVGDAAVVRTVGGRRELACRLMEMGLLPGTRVEVVRVAPLGDPLELRLRGYSLSVRRADALEVEVDDVRRRSGP